MLVLKIIDKKFVLICVHNKAPNVSTYKGLFFVFTLTISYLYHPKKINKLWQNQKKLQRAKVNFKML